MEREESSKQALQSLKNTHSVTPHVRSNTRIKDLNKKAQLYNEQITTVEPIVSQDSKMKTQKEKIPVGQARKAMLRRTPPHLLNQHVRKQFNINKSTSMNHPVDSSSINPTYTSNENYGHFGFPPASFGGSSFLPQNRISYAVVVPQDGQTRVYLYFPKLSSYTTNTSTPSSSLDKEGTPRAHDNHSDHLRLIHGGNNLGGSNPRAGSHQLPHQLSSFYLFLRAETHGNNWNYFHGQQPAQYHYVQRGRKEQPPLPSYWSSQNTNSISDNANTRPTSSSILGKRPAASSPAQSFFQPPAPLNADDMGLARGPQCELQTDDLVRLVQSVGTPEFVANSERVLRLGSSLYEPHHAASAHVPVSSSTVSEPSLLLDLENNNGEEVLGSGSSLYEPYHAAAAHVPVSSGTVSQPSLLLSLGNGNGEKGKGKEVSSYWDLSQLSAMAKTMESMKKQRQETSQPLPVKTRGMDGQGCSKSNTQRCPWN